jgi:ribosomal protein S18 acetylase RimI-like enzyme
VESITFCRLNETDLESANRLANAVVHELYGHLIGRAAYEINRVWALETGLVAQVNNFSVGVGITDQDSINDLWLLPKFRRQGIGSALLTLLEAQISERGFRHATLRAVAENQTARKFYSSQGWQELQIYPHEKWGFLMVDFSKELRL